ncbi:MAG: alpha/beta hydrolase [Chitinophagaceae bacterium]
MNFKNVVLVFLSFFLFHTTFAQNISAAQDSTLNNLIHPKGYIPSQSGELGAVKKTGNAKQSMIVIAGLGFGNEVFDSFINHYKKDYTIYAVTAAGFAGTPAPPMPDTTITYSQLTWTNGIVTGIINLIKKEKLNKPVIVAHFVTATQVALNIALNYPDKIGKLIIIGGSPYRYYPGFKDGQYNDWINEKIYTNQQRGKLVETYWAPKWFKTVTKKTWDENMWTPDDYSKDSIVGNQLFKTSAKVPVQVMIRYLIEWMSYNISEKYQQLKVPTLILIPDFKELLSQPDSSNIESCKNVAAKQYLKYFHQVAWQKAMEANNHFIEIQTIPDTRIFMWTDNPKAVYNSISTFLK